MGGSAAVQAGQEGHGVRRVLGRLRHHRLARDARALQQRPRRHVGHLVPRLLRARGARSTPIPRSRPSRRRRPSPTTTWATTRTTTAPSCWRTTSRSTWTSSRAARSRVVRSATRTSTTAPRTATASTCDGGSLMDLSRKYGLDKNPYWMMNHEHTAYDDFWKARSIWKHLTNVTPAVLVVGGWYDAEDLQRGAAHVPRAARRRARRPTATSPWARGRTAAGHAATARRRARWSSAQPTSVHYRTQIEHRFFVRLLKDATAPAIPGVSIFETGANRWRTSDSWPPASATPRRTTSRPTARCRQPRRRQSDARDEYVSDPANPVPLVGRRGHRHAARLHGVGPGVCRASRRRARLSQRRCSRRT